MYEKKIKRRSLFTQKSFPSLSSTPYARVQNSVQSIAIFWFNNTNLLFGLWEMSFHFQICKLAFLFRQVQKLHWLTKINHIKKWLCPKLNHPINGNVRETLTSPVAPPLMLTLCFPCNRKNIKLSNSQKSQKNIRFDTKIVDCQTHNIHYPHDCLTHVDFAL